MGTGTKTIIAMHVAYLWQDDWCAIGHARLREYRLSE